MPNSAFSRLSPVGFLQTFVLELMHLCEESGASQAEQIIERIAHSAARFFEEAYREEYGLRKSLDRDRYADLIIGLKNRIGGHFSLESSSAGCVRVVCSRCPFGEGVRHSPELCRMTSSVFGGIAARNFGYAKVVLERRIALGHDGCSVAVHLDEASAPKAEGIEYRPPGADHAAGQDLAALQAMIEERLHRLWCLNNATNPRQAGVDRPVLIAKSKAMLNVCKAIETIAPTAATVLIEGETGVGKELAARAIHAMSERYAKPFIAVNSGAIPEGLIESALFGHEKGAFTGAIEVHHGYFERADGGTLFLDEVDALTPAVQVRLLRVLQEGELERVGGQRLLFSDVRLIAATNYGLERAVAEGSFRRDLFYRINVVRLAIPRLSERREDIPSLVELSIRRLSARYGKAIHGVSPGLMEQLVAYAWPGNVRELENTLERAVLFAEGPVLTAVEFAAETAPPVDGQGGFKALRKQALDKLENDYLQQALRTHGGDVGQVAAAMDLTRRAVYQKLKELGINPASFRTRNLKRRIASG